MDHREKIDRARQLRSDMSLPEVILWQKIRRDELGYRVKRQQPFGDYYLDFYIRKLGVAIEVDGQIHDLQVDYDERRDARLAGFGIITIRIPARRIFEDLPSVLEFLAARLEEIVEYRKINPLPKLPKKRKKE